MAARQVEELFSNPAAAAIIYAPEMSERDFRLLDAYADRFVLTEGWSDASAFDAVATDSEASAYQAVRYLLERGHRRIGYLAGEPRLHAYRLRGRGYRRALVDAGIDCTDLPVVHMRARTEEARVDMLGWLSTDPAVPTAFLADSDRIAVGAIRALSERGFSVPQDVSVMGFEGLLSANFCTPPLTTVFVPKAEIGRFAVRKLTDALGGKREFFSTTLVAASIAARGSVRSL